MDHGTFDMIAARALPEFGGDGLHLRHRATGATVVALCNRDPEKLFPDAAAR